MCIDKDEVVLVIDDCEDNLFLMELLLIAEGYQVETACSGREGLTKINESKPDLIVLDLMMPDISGLEVMESLQASPNLSKIPILVCTANKCVGKDDLDGADDICYKPFDIGDLLNKVYTLLPCCNLDKKERLSQRDKQLPSKTILEQQGIKSSRNQ